jgi:hypothetical protein
LVELNHLELQFLLLNDFRLSVPVEELEAYGTMLVEFYAREIVAQQQMAQQHSRIAGGQMGDAMYMRDSATKNTQKVTPRCSFFSIESAFVSVEQSVTCRSEVGLGSSTAMA